MGKVQNGNEEKAREESDWGIEKKRLKMHFCSEQTQSDLRVMSAEVAFFNQFIFSPKPFLKSKIL